MTGGYRGASMTAPGVEFIHSASPAGFGVLAAAAGPALDDLTALAARLCAVPMALVSVVDGDRLLFKSRVGLEMGEISTKLSFCESAMAGDGIMIIPDTLLDPRFRDSPLVTGSPGIRFYAGTPLVMVEAVGSGAPDDGPADPASGETVTVGTLCVMDTVPRELDQAVLDDLALLARQVVSQFQIRSQAEALRSEMAAKVAAEAELGKNRRLLDEVLAHTDVLIYAKDLSGRFVLANAAIEAAVGHRAGGMLGRTDREVFPQAAAESFLHNDSQIADGGARQVFHEELELPDGTTHQYRSTKFPLLDAAGEVYAVAGVSTDITELMAVRAGLLESERRFRELFDHSPVAIGLSDEQGLWVQANAAFGRLLGVEPTELVGHSALDYAHPDDRPIIIDSELGQLSSPDQVMRAEIRFVHPDGTVRWAWASITPTPGPSGEKWTLGILQDITDRKAAENALRQSEEELAAVAAVARCVQSGADPRPVVVESIRSLSGAASVRLLEPTGDEVLTVSAGDAVTDAVTDEVTDPVTFGSGSRADQVRRTGQPMLLPLGGDLDDVGPTGTELWQPVVVEGQVIAVLQVGWNSVLSGMEDRAVAAVRVLVDEAGASLHAVQLRTELERFAATDPLTGALNRRAWAVQLQVLMEQSKVRAAPLTIALVDLDHFKAFNDANGHAAGDDLLREFAATVLGRLRSTDLFARWGGEEFVVALADCDEDRAAAMLHRVREAVPDGQSCSIGHTIWEPDETMAACIGRADSALYRAKGSGRNRLAHL